MGDSIKHLADWISNPPILFSLILVVFFFVFPPSDRLYKIHRRLGLHNLWTNGGGIAIFVALTAFMAFGVTDPNFRLVILKPDNVPIVGLLYLVVFFLWLSMKQAVDNDRRLDQNMKVDEAGGPDDKVLVWPDLLYVEFISAILLTVLLIVWSLYLKAPLEEAANPTLSPNPAKAPWYFLGLQEILVYFDPWIAGVVLPGLMVGALIAIPYIDNNPRGQGYYSFRERKMAVSMFLFCFLVLWIFLIMLGTFLRGPNWNFFGPFEYWDVHKLVPLNNVNLSEYIYLIGLKSGMPQSILVREIGGILLLGGYFLLLPLVFGKTILKKQYERLGVLRYSVFVFLLLVMFSMPIKMYLRWAFNLKYILAIPEYFFNI